MTESRHSMRLWSDEPSAVDLLAFQAIAETIADAVLDDELDPLALGVSGHWGSGKTTVLRLVEQELERRKGIAPGSTSAILVVRTDPWRYDPAVGAKVSLISEVLATLGAELNAQDPDSKALGRLRSLGRRVDWTRAIKIAARTSLTFQLPSIDDLTSLIRDEPTDEPGSPRGLDEFRDEFAELMESDELEHVKRVAVVVDDLDRCLTDTVIETLETIRLFLAVPRMSFVIAADEDRVADAIRTRYPNPASGSEEPEEEAAKLYLHKIVQTTIPLPALSRFDTEAYLFLLQLQNGENPLDSKQFDHFLTQCSAIRLRSGDLDDVERLEDVDIGEALVFAARLTPLLYEKLRGNPRRIKRFLNDLNVRQAIAERRGIALEDSVVAKMMILELLLPQEFKAVLEWLAHGVLREQIELLERQAGRGLPLDDRSLGDESEGGEEHLPSSGDAKDTGEDGDDPSFSDDFIRWAKLLPELRPVDLSPYLTLAASFRGEALLDSELPGRLRDLASNLLSSVRAEQKSVTDDDLRALSAKDASDLIGHLGRAARDRPAEQRAAVVGLLRIARLHPTTVDLAIRLLAAIGADDIQPAIVLSFSVPEVSVFRPVLVRWLETASEGPTKTALSSALA